MTNKVDDYIAGLDGWQAEVSSTLRAQIVAVAGVAETFKWGHPVFEVDKRPVCLVKAHKGHVTLAFWRGQQMEGEGMRLSPLGTFKMAEIRLKGPGEIAGDDVHRLVAAGIELNVEHGDPLKEARA